MRVERELLRGAGQAAIMSLLESGERYGYELITLLQKRSSGVLTMGQSTLYPLLYNLETKGLITSRTEVSKETNKPRKYYRLTEKGKGQLAAERMQFESLAVALGSLGLLAR